MKKTLSFIIFILIFFCQTGFSQLEVSEGLYKTILAEYGEGYCYIKKDSSFIFCGSKTVNSKGNWNYDITFNDTLTTFGIGQWKIQDSFFLLSFKIMKASILNDNILSTKSYCEKPYDSLRLKLKLSSLDQNPLNFILVTFFAVNKAAVYDKTEFDVTLPIEFRDSSFEIRSIGYKPELINFSSFSKNCYEISLQLAPNSLPEFKLIETGNKGFKFLNHPDFFIVKPFKKDTGGMKKLKTILLKNIEYFPRQKNIFNALLKELER